MAEQVTVTGVEPAAQKKFRIFLDGEYAFFLYASEIRRFKIAEGSVLTREILQKIRKECVCRHAVNKAMALLKSMDRTEKEMRDRLRREGFPEYAVEEALAYVMSYGYVDDASYAERFVYSRMDRLSVRVMRQKLLQKGISADLIEQALQENEPDEEELLRQLIEKKTHGVIPEDPKEKQKLIRFLLGRGFSYSAVGRALQETVCEEF